MRSRTIASQKTEAALACAILNRMTQLGMPDGYCMAKGSLRSHCSATACAMQQGAAFMESAVNQLVDKGMSKSQQMRWSLIRAPLILQVRVELVDGRLGDKFGRWYPGFAGGENQLYQAAE